MQRTQTFKFEYLRMLKTHFMQLCLSTLEFWVTDWSISYISQSGVDWSIGVFIAQKSFIDRLNAYLVPAKSPYQQSRSGFLRCIILLILVSSRFCHHLLLFVSGGRWLTDAAIIPGQMLILLSGIAWCVITLCHSCKLSPLGCCESSAGGYLVVHLLQFCLHSPCFVLRQMTPCPLLNDPQSSFVIM